MLIDAHCHLSQLSEEELKAVLKTAKENGVEKLVAIGSGYGLDDQLKTLNIASEHDHIFCTLATHPHDAKELDDKKFTELSRLVANHHKVVAVGEIGLDFHYMHSPKDIQENVMRRFVELACQVNKPVVIHDRECGDACLNILRENCANDLRGMVHCFSGDEGLAKKYLDIGFVVSFTGIITFKKSQALREVVKMVPLDRMTIETDSPFLAPEPHRGKTNQPAYVKYVAECIAQIKGISFEEVARITSENAIKLFGLS